MPSTPQASNNRGFTLIEVLIVSPIILLMITAFIGTIIYITGEVLVTRAESAITYNTQNTLDRISQDVYMSSNFLAQSMTVAAPQGVNGGTQRFQNTTALVLYSTATSGLPVRENRTPVWLADQPNPCASPTVNQNATLMLNYVYFVDDNNTLWRRTILPGSYTACSTPDQQRSCHPSSTHGVCNTHDIELMRGVTSFEIDYGNASAKNPALTATSRQEAIDNNSLDTITVTISSLQTVAGRDISDTGSITATRQGTAISPAS